MTHSLKLIVLLAAVVCGACSTTPPGEAGDEAERTGNDDGAAKLYRQGAEKGDAQAALKLGLLISQSRVNGYGTAGEWFIKACTLRDVVGCHNAGVGYEYAQHGLVMNYAEANRYYRLAAQRGFMQSQYNLGSLYANQHLPGDAEGLKWLLLAQRAARGCEDRPLCQWVIQDPPGHVAKLMQRMAPNDVRAVEQQVATWQPSA